MGALRELRAAPPEGLIKELSSLLERAKRGEIKGVILAAETQDGWYEFSRLSIRLEIAVALCSRLEHQIQQEWDNPDAPR